MTFDGRFRYSWNGENRMIRAEEAVVPTNRAPSVITYAYDEQGRMVAKNIAGTNSVVRSLLWDGYNIVRETDNGVPTYNVWGLDLDGTLQGCGGVGGLLAVARLNGLYVALYDANGNVSDYLSIKGSLASHYEYSPFGHPFVVHKGWFTHLFSTKPFCINLRVFLYQKRPYSPSLGRWLARDPIGESGGAMLFLACNNNPISTIDKFGASPSDFFKGLCCPNDCSHGTRRLLKTSVVVLPQGMSPESEEVIKQYKPFSHVSNFVTAVGEGISAGTGSGPVVGTAIGSLSFILSEIGVSPGQITSSLKDLIKKGMFNAMGAQVWTQVTYSDCWVNQPCFFNWKRNRWSSELGKQWRACSIGAEYIFAGTPVYADKTVALSHTSECLSSHIAQVEGKK